MSRSSTSTIFGSFIALAGWIMIAGACAVGLALAPSVSTAGPAIAPEQPTASSVKPDVPSSYIIGPGDVLQVFVWQNPNLSVTVPVRPDGKISTPLVDNMVAVGKTPSQLARDMESVLAKYLRTPKVNIIVTQPVGALTDVKVIGQVAKPGAFPFHEGMKVLDVVLDAGGLTQFAAGNRARIIRQEGGKERVIHVKLERLMDKGDISQNLPLKPNDVIVVPESLF